MPPCDWRRGKRLPIAARDACRDSGQAMAPSVHDAGRQSLSENAFPIHEIAFPLQVQLASSDSQFQRSVEHQPSDFRLPVYRDKHDAQDAEAEQVSEEPPSTQWDEQAASALARGFGATLVTGAGILAGIEPVGDQDWRFSSVQDYSSTCCGQ